MALNVTCSVVTRKVHILTKLIKARHLYVQASAAAPCTNGDLNQAWKMVLTSSMSSLVQHSKQHSSRRIRTRIAQILMRPKKRKEGKWSCKRTRSSKCTAVRLRQSRTRTYMKCWESILLFKRKDHQLIMLARMQRRRQVVMESDSFCLISIRITKWQRMNTKSVSRKNRMNLNLLKSTSGGWSPFGRSNDSKAIRTQTQWTTSIKVRNQVLQSCLRPSNNLDPWSSCLIREG